MVHPDGPVQCVMHVSSGRPEAVYARVAQCARGSDIWGHRRGGWRLTCAKCVDWRGLFKSRGRWDGPW